jgi:hypothetical protein
MTYSDQNPVYLHPDSTPPPVPYWSQLQNQPGYYQPPAAVLAPKKSHKGRVALIVVGLLIPLSVGGILLTHSTSSSTYNNPEVLAADLKELAQARLQDPSNSHYAPDLKIAAVNCIHKGGREFTCIATFADGDTTTTSVTVAADGKSYITR